jgi:hypothetical protein
VNPFTHALEPPFIRRRRDFNIPSLPSNLENIPSVNMYLNFFHISWFAGLISYISSMPLVHTSNPDFWDYVFDLVFLWPLQLHSRKSSLIKNPELRFLRLPEIRRFMTSSICQIPVVLKQTAGLRSKANSMIISHDVRKSRKRVNLTEHLYECFFAMKQNFHP